MPRIRSQRTLGLVVGLTLIVALFMPTPWVRPCTGALAGIVSVPIQPLADFGTRLSRWLWPPPDPLAEEPPIVQHLTEQLEGARQLAHARQLEIEKLLEEIRELERARSFHRGPAAVDTLFARITGRSGEGAAGLVRLNVGTRHGVEAGAIAVFRGVHLIGRVAEDPGHLSAWVVPLTHPSTGLLDVVIVPAGDPDPPFDAAPRVQLSPDGRGGLVGEVDRNAVIAPGDVAELFDQVWPAAAAAMKVGTVERVVPKESDPLLSTIVVRPQYPAHRLPSVTLKIERAPPAPAGPEGARLEASR